MSSWYFGFLYGRRAREENAGSRDKVRLGEAEPSHQGHVVWRKPRRTGRRELDFSSHSKGPAIIRGNYMRRGGRGGKVLHGF